MVMVLVYVVLFEYGEFGIVVVVSFVVVEYFVQFVVVVYIGGKQVFEWIFWGCVQLVLCFICIDVVIEMGVEVVNVGFGIVGY